MRQGTDGSTPVSLQGFASACVCTVLRRLGFTVPSLSVSLSARQLPLCSARSFAATGKRDSLCSKGEENLQTLETVVVPHATLNSMVFNR